MKARLAGWLLRHRIWVLVVFVAITAALGYHAAQLRLDPGFEKSIPLAHPYMETFKAYEDTFGGANTIIIALRQREGDIFNAEFFETYSAVNDAVSFLPGVDRSTVTSLYTPNVRFYDVNEVGFVAGRVIPADFQNTPADLERVHTNVLKSEAVGRLVSTDLGGALIRAELVEVDPQTGEAVDYDQVAQALEELRQQYQTDSVDLHIIGFAKFIGDVIDGITDVVGFFAIALVITAVLLALYTRSIALMTVTLVSVLVAVVWQLGVVVVLGYGIDPLSILVPFLVLAIGVSHAVQMTNAWRNAIAEGASSVQASEQAFARLLLPGLTALVTDALGFGVIMLIEIDIIHELGLTASVGLGVIILTNMLLLPVLLSWIRMPQARAAQPAGGRLNDTISNALARLTERPVASGVLGAAAILLVLGVASRDQVVVGDLEQGAPEFHADSRYNRDVAAITGNFAIGVDVLTVVAQAPPESCTNYEVMRQLDRFVWRISNLEGVQSVRALPRNVLASMVGLNENNPKWYGMPRSEQMIAATLYYLEISMGLFDANCEAIPVYIYPADHRAETLERIVDTVQAFDAENDVEDLRFSLASGNAGVMAATNEAVAEAQINMLIAIFGAVTVLCLATFRSIRAVVCIVLPLALVSMFANVVMATLGIGIKVSTLPVIALGVGVGVDYGIYLFSRLASLREQGLGLHEAYRQALRQIGSAVVFTSVTMTIGVSTWAFSPLKFQADMGVLLAYMFFVNMLAAVFVLPALAAWLYPRDGRPARSDMPG